MKLKLHWQIFIAMGAGALFAVVLGERALIVKPVGDVFMRLLKMIIVPLIFTSITVGVMGLGDAKTLGRMGSKTFAYYLMTSMIAIVIGLVLANTIRPGDGIELPESVEAFDASKLQKPESLAQIFVRMVPPNPVAAAAEGDILGLIFFSLLLGYSVTKLPSGPQQSLKNFFDSIFHVVLVMTNGIIRLMPIGVFALISTAVAESGFDLFRAVAKYMGTIAIGLSIHLFIVLPLVLFLFTRINPYKQFRAMASALAMAFSSSSSGATLPVTMDCIETKVGASNRVSSFVLPLGATINMDGTALYECAGVLFIAQILGIDMDLGQQFTIVITAFLASVGAAGIPSAGLVMIFVVLDAVGLSDHPQVGLIVGTMLAVDRPLDMMRTMVNVFSDSIGATIIAKSEGESLFPDT